MIDVWSDENRRWFWKISDDKGRLLLKSTGCYTTERNARQAAQAACDLVVNADIDDGLEDPDAPDDGVGDDDE